MSSEILVNGTIVTKQWLKVIRITLWSLVIWLLAVLILPASLIWFISLGHINFMGLLARRLGQLGDKLP